MIDTDEPVGQEVYRIAMEELLASPGWDYLEARLRYTRQQVIDSLIRACQMPNTTLIETSVLGARIKAIDAFIDLPLDMSKEQQERSPVPTTGTAPRGRRYMSGR